MSEIRPELHLWVAYLEKKEQLEEAQDRIEELEAALEEVRPLVTGASHSEARYPKARAALEGGKKDE